MKKPAQVSKLVKPALVCAHLSVTSHAIKKLVRGSILWITALFACFASTLKGPLFEISLDTVSWASNK